MRIFYVWRLCSCQLGWNIAVPNWLQFITSLPKVIWEEGRVAALSHTYAVKSSLVTMARPKFAPKSIPSRGPIPKPRYLPYAWTRPTYDAKRHPDPIRRFSTMHWTDRQTDRPTHVRTNRATDRPTDGSRESLTTVVCCAARATRPNKTIISCKLPWSARYADKTLRSLQFSDLLWPLDRLSANFLACMAGLSKCMPAFPLSL